MGEGAEEFYARLESPEANGERRVTTLEIPTQGFLPLPELWEHFTNAT